MSCVIDKLSSHLPKKKYKRCTSSFSSLQTSEISFPKCLLHNVRLPWNDRDLARVSSAIFSTLLMDGNNVSYLSGVCYFASKK